MTHHILTASCQTAHLGGFSHRPGWGALPRQFTEPILRFIPLDKGVHGMLPKSILAKAIAL